VREDVPIRYLVPDTVVDYIATNELYGGQGSRTEALAK
jgi:nicotinic acid mononucleotide adenylyltransferase